MPTIYFDMDGTIAGLYDVPNWLPRLRAYDPTPYLEAKPLVRMSALARKLNTLQKAGYQIGVITWLSLEPSPDYDRAVTEAKAEWLRKHLPSVHWDFFHAVPHGTPKQNYCTSPLDVLFDDNQGVRADWTGRAYDVQNILEVLKEICK
jgi:hypothetical protein